MIGSPIPIIEVTFDKTTFDGASRDSRSGIFDLACIDEAGNHFLIEMQVSTLMEMMQRMKLHALQKFNTLIFKGDYQYNDLPKIYSIAILKEKLSDDHKNYHEIGCIRSEKGRVMDQQMKFVLVELGKFTKTAEDCHTDLGKLLFTMKALSTEQPPMPEFPKFWNEEWLKIAIDELDTRKMTADERFNYIKILSYNAEVVHEEREKMAVAKSEGMAEGIEKGIEKGKAAAEAAAEVEKYALKKEAIRRMMLTKIPDAVMADIVQETLEFVKKVKAQLIQESGN